jgi:hypothetical protein
LRAEIAEPGSALAIGWKFLRDNRWAVVCLSAVVVIPCLWHRHIEAGDLGSHVYNAWLAQLIGNGQAPGLYLAQRWNNILFDIWLLHVANAVGFAAAEKIVVSACVLIFFWGVFAFIGAVTERAPWFLAPCIAMLGYGYSFNMGFMNYYLSIGLGSFCLALVWRGWAGNWVPALTIAGLVLLAHPLGLVWIAGTLGYRAMRPMLPGWWKLLVPAGEAAAYFAFRWYVHTRDLVVDWYSALPFYQANGVDQLALYGRRYVVLGWAALIFGIVCFVTDAMARRRNGPYWRQLELPLELYALLFCTTAFLPENLRTSVSAAWIGLLVSRLTTVSAIAGLCVLACAKARKQLFFGFATVAGFFFSFLYQDTARVDRMESNAEELLSAIPLGTRIIPTIGADPEWRVEFIGHLADRSCVRRCFVYSNYEPSSGQFRVRVRTGSWIVTDSAENASDMQGGAYEIQGSDLPVKQLYQCDREDWTRVCLRDLAEGESTGKAWVRPGE